MTPIHQEELSRLKRLYRESEAGHGHVVLVNGGLGVGKTDLLRDFCKDASDCGALVMRASGSRAEQMMRAGVLEQLVHSTELPAAVAIQLEALMRAEVLRDPADTADIGGMRRDEAQALHRLSGLLLERAEERPLVIAVDDIQFADSTSLNFLLWLQRRMESARVLVILTEWERPQCVPAKFHAELNRFGHQWIHLVPLGVDRVAGVLAAALDGPVPHRMAQDYHRASGGNAVLLKALLEDRRDGFADTEDTAEQEPPTGPAFARAVLSCLHAWDTDLLRVAQTLVLLGGEATPARMGQLLGLESRSVTQALDVLTDAGLLQAGRLRSRAAESVVLGSLLPAEHTRLRLHAAELLYERGAASDLVAGHLIAADRMAGAWSTAILREAAEKALADDSAVLAVRYLKLALGAESDEHERASTVETLVRAHWRLNPAAAMVHFGELEQAMQDGRLAGPELVTLIRQALWQGETAVAEKALALVRAPENQVDLKTRAAVRLAALWIHGPSTQLDLAEPEPRSEDPWTRAAGALADVWTQGSSEAATASAEHILQSCQLGDNTVEALATALIALGHGAKADKAATVCEDLIEEAGRRSAPTWEALLRSVRADIALRRGELTTAVAHADGALATLPPESWGVLIGYPLAVLVRSNTALGRYEAAARALRYVLPDALFGTVLGLRYLHARGRYHLATDQVLASLNDFETCVGMQRHWNLDLTALMPVRIDLAEANLRLGRRRTAHQLARQQLERCKPDDKGARGRALRVLAGCSELAQRQRLLADSADCLEAAGERFEHACALAELSQVYQELGEFERARETSRRATQETKACQSAPIPTQRRRDRTAEDAVPAAEQAGDADRAPMLSQAERKVAMLAALGHTNRAIGRRLFITVSTVEQHLTRVYRKLGVNGRTDLPAGLAMVGVPEPVADAEAYLL
ncbi:AAA family ATPase [Streptomyces sp. NPDC019531]|uniref:AAA family ATPase n=1 Tax=Streptomyces sp. NPDC019531 TaxID=3365062 RepID=UPI00384FC6E9